MSQLSDLADDLDFCPTVGTPEVRVVPEHLCAEISKVLREISISRGDTGQEELPGTLR